MRVFFLSFVKPICIASPSLLPFFSYIHGCDNAGSLYRYILPYCDEPQRLYVITFALFKQNQNDLLLVNAGGTKTSRFRQSRQIRTEEFKHLNTQSKFQRSRTDKGKYSSQNSTQLYRGSRRRFSPSSLVRSRTRVLNLASNAAKSSVALFGAEFRPSPSTGSRQSRIDRRGLLSTPVPCFGKDLSISDVGSEPSTFTEE